MSVEYGKSAGHSFYSVLYCFAITDSMDIIYCKRS